MRPNTLCSAAVLLSLLACQSEPTAPTPGEGAEQQAAQAAVAAYTAVDLGTLGGRSSYAIAVNNTGQVVGTSSLAGDEIQHAFLWQDGALRDLGTLGGRNSSAAGFSGAGRVIGYSETASGESHVFAWENGVMTDLGPLGTLGGDWSEGFSVNNAIQIVGRSQTANGGIRAFIWANGVMRRLPGLEKNAARAFGINNAGYVVGAWRQKGKPDHAFLVRNGVVTDLGTLGGRVSAATAISPDNRVVGSSNTANGRNHAYLWDQGVMTDLGTLGGRSSSAQAIGPLGHVVGQAQIPSGTYHASSGRTASCQTLAPVRRPASTARAGSWAAASRPSTTTRLSGDPTRRARSLYSGHDRPYIRCVSRRVRAAVAVLEQIVADRTILAHIPAEDRRSLLQAAGHVYAPDAVSRRQLVRASARKRKAKHIRKEESHRDSTGIRTLRRQPVFTSPNVFPPLPADVFAPEDVHAADAPREAREEQHCYVCKAHFTALHHFYDQMCPPCAAFNFAKRTELADLRGNVALLTGARVKIGYQAGLKLLTPGRASLSPLAFPAMPRPATPGAGLRRAGEARLEIFGLDLRQRPASKCSPPAGNDPRRLDILDQQRGQTVRRPPASTSPDGEGARRRGHAAFGCRPRARWVTYESNGTTRPPCAESTDVGLARIYFPLGESRASPGIQRGGALAGSAAPYEHDPRGPRLFRRETGRGRQQVDLRQRQLLADDCGGRPATAELLEVQLVNAIAPFIL